MPSVYTRQKNEDGKWRYIRVGKASVLLPVQNPIGSGICKRLTPRVTRSTINAVRNHLIVDKANASVSPGNTSRRRLKWLCGNAQVAVRKEH